jgi:mycothiol synthase
MMGKNDMLIKNELYSLRPAVPGDLERVLALISAQNTLDYGAPMVSPESLRTHWESLAFDLTQNTWLAFTSRGELAGYTELAPDLPDSFDVALYLANGQARLELGAYLLNLAEQRAIPPLPIYTRVSATNLAGMQIFADAGYVSRLSFLMMERGLSKPPEQAQWSSGITVRLFVPGQDEQAVYQTDETASEDKGYHAPLSFDNWAKRMNLNAPEFDPGLWFLACQGKEIAGVALNFYDSASDTGWIDHLSVLRQWRNQGLGKALLLHSFAEFHRRGISRVRLSVDSKSLTNAPRLYARVGMETIQEYHIFKKERTDHLQNGN